MSSDVYKIKSTQDCLGEVKRIMSDVKYGSVTLIIQDGKVIQIDKTEKIRL